MDSERLAEIERKTGETEIRLAINIDGTGSVQSRTGVAFLDHMLEPVSYTHLTLPTNREV